MGGVVSAVAARRSVSDRPGGGMSGRDEPRVKGHRTMSTIRTSSRKPKRVEDEAEAEAEVEAEVGVGDDVEIAVCLLSPEYPRVSRSSLVAAGVHGGYHSSMMMTSPLTCDATLPAGQTTSSVSRSVRHASDYLYCSCRVTHARRPQRPSEHDYQSRLPITSCRRCRTGLPFANAPARIVLSPSPSF
jgi:hypothetical protein